MALPPVLQASLSLRVPGVGKEHRADASGGFSQKLQVQVPSHRLRNHRRSKLQLRWERAALGSVIYL